MAQAPPGASGLPQMPQGQQTLGPQSQHGQSYSTDHLPPPPGQQQSQPSNPYGVQPGVPGAPMAQPWDTRQPQQQWGTPPQAPQGQAPAPQPQQQTPQGAPQQGRRAELDDNVILDGPGVPPELRGRTWADARRLYQALSVDWLQRNGRQQQAPAPQTPAQQSLQSQGFGQAPQQVQGGAPQQQTDPRQFWQNPDQRIAEVVGQVVEQRLGPVLQHTQGQAIMQARQIAATTTRDFDYLEPDIMQIVSGANPQDLQNPQVWIAAARMARGQRMENGQYDPRTAQQSRPQVPGQSGPNGGPGQSVPAYQAPPVHQFFSESPTAPNIPQAYGSFGQSQQPTQEDYHYAQKHQMPIQEFMAWKYGASQPVGSF